MSDCQTLTFLDRRVKWRGAELSHPSLFPGVEGFEEELILVLMQKREK